MEEIKKYITSLIKKAFSGVFLVLDIIAATAFLFSFTLEVPIWIAWCIFGSILLISGFSVWRAENKEKIKCLEKIEKLNNKKPKFQLKVYGIKANYSIDNKVKEAENTLKELEQAQKTSAIIAECIKGGCLSPSNNDSIGKQKKYIEQLQQYDKRIKNIHQYKMTLLSDKHASNVHIEVEGTGDEKLFLEDDFIQSNLPEKPKIRTTIPIPNITPRVPTFGYGRDYVENNIAIVELERVNAGQKYDLPDNEFYILTDKKQIYLKAKIYCTEINEPQVITIKVNAEA